MFRSYDVFLDMMQKEPRLIIYYLKPHHMNRIFIITLILDFAQLPVMGQSILDQYVKQAIAQNLTVDQRKALERKQQYALEHAGKMGGPEIGFLTTYTAAYKGRNIEFPLGDLLNPVYSCAQRTYRHAKLSACSEPGIQSSCPTIFMMHVFASHNPFFSRRSNTTS